MGGGIGGVVVDKGWRGKREGQMGGRIYCEEGRRLEYAAKMTRKRNVGISGVAQYNVR